MFFRINVVFLLQLIVCSLLLLAIEPVANAVSRTPKKAAHKPIASPLKVYVSEQVQNPNPILVGGTGTVALTSTLSGTDASGVACNLTSQAWTWAIKPNTTQYSTNGNSFSTPTSGTVAPNFSFNPPTSTSDNQHSVANPTALVASTQSVAPATTPGYWQVTVTASVNYTSTNCGNGTKQADRIIVFAIGPGNAVDFSIQVSPQPLTFPQGTGGTTQVTVTSLHGYSGDVLLSVSGNPSGGDNSFYDPTVYPQPESQPTVTLHLVSGYVNVVTLTICEGGSVATGSYTLNVKGTSGTSLSHSQNLTVNVTPALTAGGKYPGPGSPVTVPGGLGRKMETKTFTFCGLSADVVFPSTDSTGSSIVTCGDHGDEVYTYSGGSLNTAGIAMDAGFQLGHTGNPSWKSYIADSSGTGQYVLANGKATSTPTLVANGAGHLILELPGYKRQSGEPAFAATDVIVDPKTGIVNNGYIILSLNGKEVYFYSPKWTQYAARVKRCNTIAQNIPKNSSNQPTGNGPGSGFFYTGTTVLGGAWKNVTLYDKASLSGKNFTSTDVVDETYPGAPFVGWDIPKTGTLYNYYYNEFNINLSTVPLATSQCPNP